MKTKWIAGGVILVLLLSFAACSLLGGDKKVLNVSIYGYTDDNVGGPLDIIPDYDLRTLTVYYETKTYRDSSKFVPIDTSGVIGGDFFDRFEEIVSTFEDKSSDPKTSDSGSILTMNWEDGSSTNFYYDIHDYGRAEENGLVSSFYDDVISLFSEDVY